MTAPVQTPTLEVGKIEYVTAPPRLPEWWIDYLQARRRALLQELRYVEKTLVEAGALPPTVLTK